MVVKYYLMESFNEWIEGCLHDRGWRPSDLARAASIKDATLSRILNQTRQAGPDVCRAIARALKVDEEEVFRRAGLLNPLPHPVAEERELLRIFRKLPGGTRSTILQMLRSLIPTPSITSAIAEDRTVYHYTMDDEAR